MKIKKIMAAVLTVVSCCQLPAQVKLPSVLADSMVLQQRSRVAVWGKAAPDKKVKVTTGWDNKSYMTVSASDSCWKVTVTTPEASYRPYNIKIKCGQTIELNHVLIGEVWLCGGQSNMEMPVKGFKNQPVEGSIQDIANSYNENLRCYTLKLVSSVTEHWDCPGRWEMASPGTTGNFTATGYYFARQLQQVLRVPVAILHCSWGGSTIEAWMSPEAMNGFPDMKIPQTDVENKIRWKSPTVLYNGMLKALVGYGMRGVVWYQGESNYTQPDRYIRQFEAMHNDWMKRWEIGPFPIYFAQLAPFAYDPRNNCAFMREAQEKIAQTQPLTAMAVLMDVGDSLCIHPPRKREVGERLAYLAMMRDYGFESFAGESPRYKSFEVKDNRIMLHFDQAPNWLTSFYEPLTAFEIAGADRRFYPAKATLTRHTLIVEAPEVPCPVAVRYAFKNQTPGNLFGVNGLPVSSFRTDNWDDVR